MELDAVLAGVHAALRRPESRVPLAHAVERALETERHGPLELPAWARVPGADRYGRHVLHRDPAGRFCVVSIVLEPGQSTPIHDHTTWGVISILQGRQREVRYALSGGELVELGWHYNEKGALALVTPPEDIHRIEGACPRGGLTISLHVYGTEENRVLGRSYPAPPTRTANVRPSWIRANAEWPGGHRIGRAAKT